MSAQRGIAGQIDRKRLQRSGDRIFGAISDRRDLPAAEVLQDHALEQVVDLFGLELELDLGVAIDLPRCSKKPTPALNITSFCSGKLSLCFAALSSAACPTEAA